MSYYYNYAIGYIHEGKLYPLGPYTRKSDGTYDLKYVISRSRSFASNLYERFWELPPAMYSNALLQEFPKESYPNLKYLDAGKLPTGSYIKSGYFLIEDVMNYEKGYDVQDLFYDSVSPTVYSQMLQNEIMFGKPEMEKDCEGEEYRPKTASDYMYYAYPNYYSAEYEAEVLRQTIDSLDDYATIPKDARFVIILSEG